MDFPVICVETTAEINKEVEVGICNKRICEYVMRMGTADKKGALLAKTIIEMSERMMMVTNFCLKNKICAALVSYKYQAAAMHEGVLAVF